MAKNELKFTKSAIDKLQPTQKRETYYDSEVKGLCIQITPNGAKSYYLYKKIKGIPTRIRLGGINEIKLEQARLLASQYKEMARMGKNPQNETKRYKDETKMQEMYDDFIEDRERYIGKRTIVGYKSMWTSKLSKLGKKRISEITGDDLRRIHHKISQEFGIYTGNHCIELVKAIYNHAIKEEKFDGRNPAMSVKLNKTEARVRYLEHSEMERFFQTLTEYDNEISRDAILMLIFTGARKRNVLEMNWNDIDLSAKVWKIPQTKTAKNQTLALVEPAIEVLQRRFSTRVNEWVFYSANSKSGHLEDIKRAWQSVLKKANITNLRIHDLRHTLATYMIANGADAFMVKRALTHKSLQSTEVYVNLGIEHLRDKLNDTVDKMINIGKK
ncbi:MAG: site-specific integrase [Alphaproteobacteria bacterium]